MRNFKEGDRVTVNGKVGDIVSVTVDTHEYLVMPDRNPWDARWYTADQLEPAE